MTEKPQQPTENYLTYGSIVSLMLDFNESNTASTLASLPKYLLAIYLSIILSVIIM